MRECHTYINMRVEHMYIVYMNSAHWVNSQNWITRETMPCILMPVLLWRLPTNCFGCGHFLFFFNICSVSSSSNTGVGILCLQCLSEQCLSEQRALPKIRILVFLHINTWLLKMLHGRDFVEWKVKAFALFPISNTMSLCFTAPSGQFWYIKRCGAL